MENIMTLPRIDRYVGISEDSIKTLKDGRTFRVLIYGAYDAMGLIGSEINGICVLDEDNKRVVADQIGRESTGYFGPSKAQLELFNTLMEADDDYFCKTVTESTYCRVAI